MISEILFLVVALILPVLLCIIIGGKYKVKFIIFILGLLTFFISQVLFRIPILKYIEMFHIGLANNLYYKMTMPFTAGIVEVGADYIALRYFVKSPNVKDTLMLGAAHAFCENITITAIINMIIMLATGNGIITVSYWGSFERFFALVGHIAFALFAYYAVKKGKIIYLFLGMLLHGFTDLPILFMNSVSELGKVEIIIAMISVLSFILIIYILKSDSKKVLAT